MKIKDVFYLIVCVAICLLAGIIGSQFTKPGLAIWYKLLKKPSLTPPNFVFAPVWTILFILMGISLYLVLKAGLKTRESKFAVAIFFTQLIFNIAWSAAFFALRSPLKGFIIIVILLALILLNTVEFYRISKPAGVLFIPYLIWVSFAAYLNYSVMILNP